MELMNPGQDTAFTFVLVWTLFYGEQNCCALENLLILKLCPHSTGVVHGEFFFTSYLC
jgi:hypothetical protein